jgi:hypothetical protein
MYKIKRVCWGFFFWGFNERPWEISLKLQSSVMRDLCRTENLQPTGSCLTEPKNELHGQ